MTKSFPDLKKEMGIHAHKTLDSEQVEPKKDFTNILKVLYFQNQI